MCDPYTNHHCVRLIELDIAWRDRNCVIFAALRGVDAIGADIRTTHPVLGIIVAFVLICAATIHYSIHHAAHMIHLATIIDLLVFRYQFWCANCKCAASARLIMLNVVINRCSLYSHITRARTAQTAYICSIVLIPRYTYIVYKYPLMHIWRGTLPETMTTTTPTTLSRAVHIICK